MPEPPGDTIAGQYQWMTAPPGGRGSDLVTIRLMLADDHRMLREGLRRSMLDQGFDVRDNVKFLGQNLAWFIHDRYPGVGCVLAIEFKKTFMDEWTGEPDHERLEYLAEALEKTFGPVQEALDMIPQRHIPRPRDPEQSSQQEDGGSQ